MKDAVKNVAKSQFIVFHKIGIYASDFRGIPFLQVFGDAQNGGTCGLDLRSKEISGRLKAIASHKDFKIVARQSRRSISGLPLGTAGAETSGEEKNLLLIEALLRLPKVAT